MSAADAFGILPCNFSSIISPHRFTNEIALALPRTSRLSTPRHRSLHPTAILLPSLVPLILCAGYSYYIHVSIPTQET